VIEALDGSIRLLEAPGQGLAIARNVAIKNAKSDFIAFTDDDVIVDSQWLRNLARGFARAERVACVCGMVPSAELDTPAQSYFDVVSAGRGAATLRSSISQTHRTTIDSFRSGMAQFGTGANFAVRRDVLLELGGFDEGMASDPRTGGGEDIDIFVRILWRVIFWSGAVSGGLAPTSTERRRTRDADPQLRTRPWGWITKLGLRPRTFGMALRRLRPAVSHLRGVAVVDQSDTIANDPRLVGLDRRELNGVLGGPLALARARLAGRKAPPV